VVSAAEVPSACTTQFTLLQSHTCAHADTYTGCRRNVCSCSLEKELNGFTFSQELIRSFLDGCLADFVVETEASDGSIAAGGQRAREREHDASWDVVEGAVSLEGNRLPVIRSIDPVTHVVDGGITGRGGRRKLTELDDLSTTFLDAGCELFLDPGGVNEGRSSNTADRAVPDVGVHSGGVVAPDGHLLDVGDLGVGHESKLGQSSVVIKTGHGCEGRGWEIRSIVLADKGVRVGGVADDDRLAVTGGVIIDSFADINEDRTVVLEEISALHTGAARLSTDEEVVVYITEGCVKITSDDDFVKKRESAIVELSLHSSEDLFLEGKVKEVEDDTLVLAQELTRRDPEYNRVSDLAGSSRDEDTLGRGVGDGGGAGHRSLGDLVELVHTGELVE